jgi:hypothetical protein
MQPTPENSHYLLNVHLEIPGLRLDDLAALVFAQKVVAPIESALRCAGMLAAGEPDQEMKDVAYQAAKVLGELMAAIRGKQARLDEWKKLLTLDNSGAAKRSQQTEAAALMALDTLKALHNGRGIFGFGHDNWCFLAMEVADATTAGTILFAELDRLQLLAFCEVAVFDPARNALRTVFPLNCERPFDRYWELCRQVCAAQMAQSSRIAGELRKGKT